MSSASLQLIASSVNRTLSKDDTLNPLTRPTTFIPEDITQNLVYFWSQFGVLGDSTSRFIFVGSFMTVFDFEPIAVAADLFLQNDINVQFVICGDGEMRKDVHNLFADLPNVVLPGWVSLEEKAFLYSISTASLIPYKNIKNYTSNFPNKVVDSLSYSVPIVTSLSGYLLEVLQSYEIGLFYDGSDSASLYSALLRLVLNPDLVAEYSSNSFKLYQQNYSYQVTYSNLCSTIERLAKF